jgi:hypothetical protein
MRIPHVAVITGGRSPRPELLAELSAKLGQIRFDEFGALAVALFYRATKFSG